MDAKKIRLRKQLRYMHIHHSFTDQELEAVRLLYEQWKISYIKHRRKILPGVSVFFVRKYKNTKNKKYTVEIYEQSECCGLFISREKIISMTEDEQTGVFAQCTVKVRNLNVENLIVYWETHTSCLTSRLGCNTRSEILRALKPGPISIKELDHIKVSRGRKREILDQLERWGCVKRFLVDNVAFWDLKIEEIPQEMVGKDWNDDDDDE